MFDVQNAKKKLIESYKAQQIVDARTKKDKLKQALRNQALNDLQNLEEPPQNIKKSKMSMTLLQNYILAICLMKNITVKFLCS